MKEARVALIVAVVAIVLSATCAYAMIRRAADPEMAERVLRLDLERRDKAGKLSATDFRLFNVLEQREQSRRR